MKSAVLFFLLFSADLAKSQPGFSEWKTAESFVRGRTINNARELKNFGKEVKSSFTDTLDRVRVAYLWVINNISYDCEGLKNRNSRWALDSVLKNKRAVCAGYVNVFRNLCEAAGVECIDVPGFGRSGLEDLLVKVDSFASNHTWNAVRIDGKWYLIDVTWASGFTSEDCKSFTRMRNDWYFCADPKKFIWDHYPKDKEWQLLEDPVEWTVFRSYPILFPGVVENRLNDFYPRVATLNKSIGDTIQFRFSTDKLYNKIIISCRKYPELYRMDNIQSTRAGYTYIYRVERQGEYDLQIDLLNIENLRPLQSYQVKSYTDIVYWLSVKN